MPLQSDPTIVYGIFGGEGKPSDRPIFQSDLQKDTPYNTYKIKGLPPRRVFTHHVLRTAMIPILVMFGMDFAGLLGGAIFTETIFGLPGLGGFVMEAMQTMDFAMLFIGGLIAATFVIVSNTVVDLLQALLDPKLRTA